MAQVLIDGGASKTIKDKEGHTPYDLICTNKYATCSASARSKLEFLLSL